MPRDLPVTAGPCAVGALERVNWISERESQLGSSGWFSLVLESAIFLKEECAGLSSLL